MVHVHNFVAGAFASRQAAKNSLEVLQVHYVPPLRIRRVWHLGTYLYFIVY